MKAIIKKLYFTGLMGILVVCNACQEDEVFENEIVEGAEPSADFSGSSGSLEVNFTNLSEDGDSYYWEFGDGGSSSENSPTHIYANAGTYNVTLNARSAAGYSDSMSKELFVAGPSSAAFSVENEFKLIRRFDASGSQNAASFSWDFGDGSAHETAMVLTHEFPAEGSYEVSLTVVGLLGDTKVLIKTIDVYEEEINLLEGSDMENSAKAFWTNWSSQNSNPPEFGYTGDGPEEGEGASLRFNNFTAPQDNSVNQLIYQEVNVTAGGKYRLEAKVKAPEGAYQTYIQFYISKDPNTWIEDVSNPDTNHFLALNTWHGWMGPVDGDLYQAVQANGGYGLGASTGGIYTATETGKLYIGIQVGTWSGYSNGDILVDEVKFIRVE
ncbi:MAG: PKD domain-containing protein [Zunongwangia sp.]|uniref:Cell surface protein n=1 Tax=Zunongwangia profunda (strain DSM 18752 / CCTCC AB 206139 / SM-A87) TaxID=655815 RepID=D5BJU7_ZUNPS|nr:PKD domain-containing protein [Zunongwangia profunda]ADF53795.1 cell surface protein [Zunongwangia profunda SM-A87]MAB91623.1 PKD domain-containing protein [Planctomycetota bacterium]MAO34839.1 PKD domain-containing protein [Zunongwangia sp.]|tara:strand:+ start:931 stop:2076 length:1146 start_codon:yes stop_codon:yes gene_type:complete